MSEGVLNPETMDDDGDAALRPRMLSDFIGQGKLKSNLGVFVQSAKTRGDVLDHTLFSGPPGLGKTTLAQIIANEMGVGFRMTSGPIISKAGDLAALLTNIQPMDVLFIDEIHRLQPTIEEVLYPAMEDFQLDLLIGEGPNARSIRIDLPKFTLIGATTRTGLLTTPLRDRFGILSRLEFYTHDELTDIVSRGAKKLGYAIKDDGANEIARRSRGTPRIAIRLLRRVRDFATVKQLDVIDAACADFALSALDVDDLGLDSMDRRYLRAIAEQFDGGPVGIETVCAALSEQRDTLEETVEPYLLQQGLLQRTPRGRVITRHAFDHLKIQHKKPDHHWNNDDPKSQQTGLFDPDDVP